MERGFVSAMATNGAGIIHDFEIALVGATSEDVDASLPPGAVRHGRRDRPPVEPRDHRRCRSGARYRPGCREVSAPTATATRTFQHYCGRARLDSRSRCTSRSGPTSSTCIPTPRALPSAKAACGTSGTSSRTSPGSNAASISIADPPWCCRRCSSRPLALARNRGVALEGLTTVNLDFMRSYRPQTNVVTRPTAGTGRGYSLVGHHEIMIPSAGRCARSRQFARGLTVPGALL